LIETSRNTPVPGTSLTMYVKRESGSSFSNITQHQKNSAHFYSTPHENQTLNIIISLNEDHMKLILCLLHNWNVGLEFDRNLRCPLSCSKKIFVIHVLRKTLRYFVFFTLKYKISCRFYINVVHTYRLPTFDRNKFCYSAICGSSLLKFKI